MFARSCRLRRILPAVALLAVNALAMAHDPGLSTLQIKVLPDRIETELIFARADVEAVLKLDADGDGKVSAAELASAKSRTEKIAFEALSVRLDAQSVLVGAPAFRLDETNNVHIAGTFPATGAGRLSVTSLLIEKMPRGHRQFVSVRDLNDGLLAEEFLKAGHETIDVDFGSRVPTMTFQSFFWLGVTHIITGYDHLLFLFALLFVTPTLRSAALIITSFTIAHSITLGAATLNWVNVDSRYTEPMIAVTIVYVGVENLIRRGAPRGRWLLTFAFGLIHGFGFASVLRELGVSAATTGIAVPLFSFNLGVETGQIAIAAVILPIILALRTRPLFVRRWVPALSALIIALGVFWFVQRVFS